MRVGDFSAEVVPHQEGVVRELDSGHVLARPGQVYRLRLRNHGPLRAVAEIDIDGRSVTEAGLVLRPWSVMELERPLRDGEHGRFTIVAEGNERVFGPDGGRDNESLGVIKASFRRELPPPTSHDMMDDLSPFVRPIPAPELPRRSRFSREWSPPMNVGSSAGTTVGRPPMPSRPTVEREIERAAGTGLSGHSDQTFVPIQLGELESEATVITLRLVIGSEEALADESPRALHPQRVPERPAPRP
jgi:hypothetical protein